MKDEICRVGGVLNIPIDHYSIQSVKNLHGRYLADLLKAKHVLQEKETEKAKDNNAVENETGMEDADDKIKWEINLFPVWPLSMFP